MDKRKIYGTILGGIAFLAVILAVTYARYTWQSSNTDLSFSISDSYFYCESGIDSSVSSLSPVLDYRSGAVNSFWVNNIGMYDTTFSISLDISRIDASLKDKSFKYKIMLDSSGGSKNCASTSESGCTAIAEGDFSNAIVGMNSLADVVTLPNNSKYHYYLFIYIDGNMQNSTAMQSSTMSYTIDVCEVVAFFDYNGGTGDKTFLKVADTYDGLPTATKGNTVIAFNSNGGSSAASQTITHTLDGWYLEEAFTNKIVEDAKVNKVTNHTLHAKWNMTDSSGTSTTDGCVDLPTITRAGYTFKGWYKESSFTNKVENQYCISRDESPKNVTLYAKWVDEEKPVGSITTTATLKSGTQTATLKCTDTAGVTKYYWGTSSTGTPNTTITSTTSMSIEKTVNAAGTYYLVCQDAAGNKSTSVNKVYYGYTVNNMLLNVTGTETTYTTSHYTQASTGTYVAPSGTTLTLASIYTKPTGGNSFKGYYAAATGTSNVTLSTTAPTLSSNSTYAMYFNRLTYTITGKASAGGTNKLVNQRSSTATASSGGSTTITVRYGEKVTATATASTGYTFTGWSGLLSGTTNPGTTSTLTAAGTITASFADQTKPVGSITTTSTLKSGTQTATLKCTDGVGVTKYYWGTSSTGTPDTAVTSTTSMSIEKTVNAAGTYYLVCQDAAGNKSTSVNKVYYGYTVNNMLLNVTGTETTYTTSHYTQASTGTYVAPSGTTLTLASIYTKPTGGNTFKGYYAAATSTSTVTLSTTAPTLTATKTYAMYFNRSTYTITGKSGTGGTAKLVNQNGSTKTASSGGSTTITVRYGEKVTATATASSGYTFTGWSGLLSGTTNPGTTSSLTAAGTITASFADQTKPVASITTTATLKSTSQTATLKCTDGVGVTKYYWGTSSSGTPNTDITSTTSMSIEKTVNAAGTYYLVCQDAVGNKSTAVSKTYYSYTVNNMLLNVTGTETTYTTSHYTQASTGTYVAPSGTTLTLASIYTKPTGGNSFKGYYAAATGSSNVTLSTTAPTLSSNSTYAMYFNRLTYTITGKAGTGGTNKLVNQNGSTKTASSGGSTTITVRYGEKVTATATASSGYTFTGWSGLLSGTTNPGTTSTLTAAGTITASFADQTKPVGSITTTSTLKSTSQTATLKCTDGVGVTKYYWGTSSTGTPDTAITSTTSMSVTKTVNAAGTYYLVCQDAVGNKSTAVSKTYYSYTVNNMLLNVTGTETTYTTSHYTQASTGTYVAPTGTTLTLASIYTKPTGGNTFKGYYAAATSTSTVTLSSTAPTLSSNSTYAMYFNRLTYTITGKAGTGGTNKLVNQRSSTATASSGGSTTITVRYGEKVTATATASSGYTFTGWSGLLSGTTNPGTTSTLTAAGTITASFADQTKPVGSITTTSTLKSGTQTATLKCTDGVGVTKYYWGTSSTGTPDTAITSTTSMSVTKTVNAAGTYYLVCQDAAGNKSTAVSKTYYSYIVNNMLLKTGGTKGTYTTNNYDTSSTATYVAPSGTTLTLASIYTVPTGASSSTFKGVSSGAPGTTTVTVSSTAPTLSANSTYGLWFDRTEYTISYDACSGTGAPSAQTKRHGKNLTLSSTKPTRSGYSFTGWGTSCNSSVVYQPGGTYSTDASTTLYAQWVNTYTVTFYNGSTSLGTQTLIKSTATALNSWSTLGGTVSNSSKGWEFAGWSTSSSATSVGYNDGANITITANTNLYAIYKRTITFYSGINKATTDGTRIQYYNSKGGNISSVTTYTPAAITDWSILGYRDDTTAGSSEYAKATSVTPIVTSSQYMYAVYSRTFSTTCYSGVNKATAKTVTSSTVYYNSSATATATSGNITLPTPTAITGWTASGWRTNTTDGAATNATGATVSTANTYYAVYSRTFTATFYSGVNKATTKTVTSTAVYYNANTASTPTTGGSVTTPTPASISGWTALGWRANTTASTATSASGATVATGTYYAVYSRTFTATFYSGVNKATTKTVTSTAVYYNANTSATPTTGGSVTTPTPASISGWTALGWRADKTATTASSATGATVATGTYYAVYSRTFSSTFYSGVNKATSKSQASSTVYYNTDTASTPTSGNITPPTAATISGWTAIGWRTDTSAAVNTYKTNATVSSANANYYAVYRRTIIVSYNANGGSGTTADTTNTIYLNTNATTTSSQSVTLAANNFTRSNYGFTKWALGSASGTQYAAGASYNPSLAYNASTFVIKMYALWEQTTYTVALNPNGGTIPSTTGWTITSQGTAYKSVNKGSTYGTLPTPTRSGYAFNNWWTARSYGNLTLTSDSSTNYKAQTIVKGLQPGVTYKITMDSATKTAGTTTKFSAIIHNFGGSYQETLAKVDVSFGNNISFTLECPSTADKNHDLQLLIYAGVPGATSGNSVTFTNIQVWSADITTSYSVTSSYTVTTTGNHMLYAEWIPQNYGVASSCAPSSGTYSSYYSTLANAISGATAGQCITLLKDMYESASVFFNKNLSLSTNGYTLTVGDSIGVNSGISVTKVGAGTITTSSSSISTFSLLGTANLTVSAGRLHSEGAHAVNMYGDGRNATLTVSGGTLTNNASGDSVVPVYPAGKVTVSSGTIYGAVGLSLYGTATVSISGGHIYSTKNNTIRYNYGTGNITMTGGTIGNTSYNLVGLAFGSSGSFTMSGGTINVGKATAAYNGVSGTMTLVAGTISSKAAAISNAGTGTLKLGAADNTGTMNVSTSGAGYSVIYCGNSDSGSNALCMLYKGTRVSTSTGRALYNHNGDFRVFTGAQITCSTTASYACLYNAGSTYSNTSCPNLTTGNCEFGQIFVQKGYVQSVHAVIHSKVLSDYGVWIGSTYNTLYTKSNFVSANYTVDINSGPMVRASDTTDGRGVYMDTINSKWIFNDGIVGGKKTYTNQTPTVQRSGYSIGNFSYGGYNYGYLG